MGSKVITRGLAAIAGCVAIALGVGILTAQEYRGRVQGVVSDASHAAVANYYATYR